MYIAHARPFHDRAAIIYRSLQAREYPTAASLGRKMEVSRKTIQRDIEFMRSRWGLPIQYDRKWGGYTFTGPVGSLPMMAISEGELFAFLVAQRAIEQYEGTPFAEPLRHVFEKISAGLSNVVHVSTDMLSMPVSFRTLGGGLADAELFQLVSNAVMAQQEIAFSYRKLDDEDYQPRSLQPYHMICIENQWYVVGFDPLRQGMRTFCLARMRGVKLLDKAFERPEDFSIEEHMKHAFSAFAGEARHAVHLRFDTWASRLISERRWPPGFEFTELDDGTLEARITVAALEDIEHWVLSWGSHVTVLAPTDLHNRIQTHARKILMEDFKKEERKAKVAPASHLS